jgi:hypothetical protein
MTPPSIEHGSYDAADVRFLLKALAIPFTPIAEKERLIQSGARHYSEIISPEAAPGPAYMALYRTAMRHHGDKLARHINTLAAALAARPASRQGLALVSLVRAGTPIGVLLTRALRRRGLAVEHYSISIIRGRGLDLNAMRYILASHSPDDVVFIDGWTGKGAIAAELRGEAGARAIGVSPFLTVVADPAGQADLAATGEDYLIPSGILNGVVSGLVSRSILNDQIGADDFHGCVVFQDLVEADISKTFVDEITALLPCVLAQSENPWSPKIAVELRARSASLIDALALRYGVRDRNRIKPGIAEATRAVLRRMPERLLVADPDDASLEPLMHLAQERRVPVELIGVASTYRAVVIIAAHDG